MTLHPNSTLQGGKYKIEKVLGQGGFGITYLAEQTMLERKVAIKEFFMKDFCERDESTSHVTLGTAGSHATVERFRQKFIKEARSIAKLDHQHIVQVLDVFEENGTAYYVMNFCSGGSLASKVADGKCLPEAQATRYILQIADALAYIHERRMNHLDIKPGNVMLNEKDNTMLIDFGLSKQYDEGGQQTSTTPVGISEGYAPMEQYKQGGVKEFSPETDIYALGATFFKLLTGKTPPGASDVYDEGLPVAELEKKGVSQAVTETIARAMEPRRKKRFQSVGDFVESIQMKPHEEVAHPAETHSEKTEIVLPEAKPDNDYFSETPLRTEEDNEATNFNDGKYEDPKLREISEDELVDLGLSVKWCGHNFGAQAPNEYGKYSTWLEDRLSLWETCQTEVSATQKDVVFRDSAGRLRTPSTKEMKELIDKCKWSWTQYKGVSGFKVTGPSGNSIFLPAAGKKTETSTIMKDKFGYYWSSTKSNVYPCAYYMYFNDNEIVDIAYEMVSTCRTIRPVEA